MDRLLPESTLIEFGVRSHLGPRARSHDAAAHATGSRSSRLTLPAILHAAPCFLAHRTLP